VVAAEAVLSVLVLLAWLGLAWIVGGLIFGR
jgi:hypothetical protein